MNKARQKTLMNAAIDGGLLVTFLITTAPQFTGISWHEWLSLGLAMVVVVHIILHRQWVVAVAKHFIHKATWSSRFSFGLNTLLFIAFTLVIYSGIAISESAMPFFGIGIFDNQAWRFLHHTFSNISLIIIAIHVALHWQWIVNLFRKRVISHVSRKREL
ncbi:MAG: DUF4405 domain-containing protein [Roseiflexaceae bacterium]|jgi:hypothetical protein